MYRVTKRLWLLKLCPIYYLAASLVLNEIIQVATCAQFFRITKGNLHVSEREPFLASDVFRCRGQKSCTKLLKMAKSKEEKFDSSNAVLEMNKDYGTPILYQSCAIALTQNGNQEGLYNIQHEAMLRPIKLECRIINNTVYAVAHHNSEITATVIGYEEPGAFRKQIKYTNNWQDLISFVDSSFACRQLTRFDCYGSLIHGYKGMFSYLVDRNGSAMKYIGAGPIDGNGCECARRRTCAMKEKICNCDANDRVWRYDGGFVAEKHRLPLREVRVGDTGTKNEIMRYTIGPLECQWERYYKK